MERFARGGGKIRPRAKENEQTGENKLNKRGKEGMDTGKDYDITGLGMLSNSIPIKIIKKRIIMKR